MQRFTNSILAALDSRNWYGALTLALALPDICGWLENPKVSSRARCIAWWNKFLIAKYTSKVGANYDETVFLNGNDFYALRCAYLHQGGDDITDQNARYIINKFMFVAPKENIYFHCNTKINDVHETLQLQVDVFCRDICFGVEQWILQNASDVEIVRRINEELIIIHDLSGGIIF